MPFIAPQAGTLRGERLVFAFPLALCFVHSPSPPPSLPAPSPLPAYDQREHATESDALDMLSVTGQQTYSESEPNQD
jgi:hypothetical protein